MIVQREVITFAIFPLAKANAKRFISTVGVEQQLQKKCNKLWGTNCKHKLKVMQVKNQELPCSPQ